MELSKRNCTEHLLKMGRKTLFKTAAIGEGDELNSAETEGEEVSQCD